MMQYDKRQYKEINPRKKCLISVRDYDFHMEVAGYTKMANKNNGEYLKYKIHAAIKKGDKIQDSFYLNVAKTPQYFIRNGFEFSLEDFRISLSSYFLETYEYSIIDSIDQFVENDGVINNSIEQTIELWNHMKKAYNILSRLYGEKDLETSIKKYSTLMITR